MDRQGEDKPELDDRRSALRQSSRVETLQVEHATAGVFTANLLDISREGFRLLLPVSVPCGDELLLHPPVGTDLLKIRTTVVRQCLSTHGDTKMIECGAEVADTAAWRKHVWYLKLRSGSAEYEAARQQDETEAAA